MEVSPAMTTVDDVSAAQLPKDRQPWKIGIDLAMAKPAHSQAMNATGIDQQDLIYLASLE